MLLAIQLTYQFSRNWTCKNSHREIKFQFGKLQWNASTKVGILLPFRTPITYPTSNSFSSLASSSHSFGLFIHPEVSGRPLMHFWQATESRAVLRTWTSCNPGHLCSLRRCSFSKRSPYFWRIDFRDTPTHFHLYSIDSSLHRTSIR